MSNKEEKFKTYVESVRFDDEPTDAHREKLEKKLLEAYDHEQKYGDYVEPVGIYLRKLAIAASFLIVCGLLFWGIDSMFIDEQSYLTQHPEKEAIKQIIKAENVTGQEKVKLLTQINEVWDMIGNQDTDALVAVLETNETAYALRKWAAKYLGKFGGEDTLAVLETTIDHLDVTNPENPLMIAAEKIRQRLGLPQPPRTKPDAPNSNGGLEAAPDDACLPEQD